MDQKSGKLNFRPAGVLLFLPNSTLKNTPPGALLSLGTARFPIQTGNNCKWTQQGLSPMTSKVISLLKSIGAALRYNGCSAGRKLLRNWFTITRCRMVCVVKWAEKSRFPNPFINVPTREGRILLLLLLKSFPCSFRWEKAETPNKT